MEGWYVIINGDNEIDGERGIASFSSIESAKFYSKELDLKYPDHAPHRVLKVIEDRKYSLKLNHKGNDLSLRQKVISN